MIVVTGAAGFIASYLAETLNKLGHTNLILVDDFSVTSKKNNWIHLSFDQCIDREAFLPWFEQNSKHIDFVFHLGAKNQDISLEFIACFFGCLGVNVVL